MEEIKTSNTQTVSTSSSFSKIVLEDSNLLSKYFECLDMETLLTVCQPINKLWKKTVLLPASWKENYIESSKFNKFFRQIKEEREENEHKELTLKDIFNFYPVFQSINRWKWDSLVTFKTINFRLQNQLQSNLTHLILPFIPYTFNQTALKEFAECFPQAKFAPKLIHLEMQYDYIMPYLETLKKEDFPALKELVILLRQTISQINLNYDFTNWSLFENIESLQLQNKILTTRECKEMSKGFPHLTYLQVERFLYVKDILEFINLPNLVVECHYTIVINKERYYKKKIEEELNCLSLFQKENNHELSLKIKIVEEYRAYSYFLTPRDCLDFIFSYLAEHLHCAISWLQIEEWKESTDFSLVKNIEKYFVKFINLLYLEVECDSQTFVISLEEAKELWIKLDTLPQIHTWMIKRVYMADKIDHKLFTESSTCFSKTPNKFMKRKNYHSFSNACLKEL